MVWNLKPVQFLSVHFFSFWCVLARLLSGQSLQELILEVKIGSKSKRLRFNEGKKKNIKDLSGNAFSLFLSLLSQICFFPSGINLIKLISFKKDWIGHEFLPLYYYNLVNIFYNKIKIDFYYTMNTNVPY